MVDEAVNWSRSGDRLGMVLPGHVNVDWASMQHQGGIWALLWVLTGHDVAIGGVSMWLGMLTWA